MGVIIIFFMVIANTALAASNKELSKPVREILDTSENQNALRSSPIRAPFVAVGVNRPQIINPSPFVGLHQQQPSHFTPTQRFPQCTQLDFEILNLMARYYAGLNPQPFRYPNGFQPNDPYFLYLVNFSKKYLPYGLGPQGIYGSTGLPSNKPPGVFSAVDKVDNLQRKQI